MSQRTTPGQRLAELLRELSMKRKYYPTWVENHRLGRQGLRISQEDADHRIACFEDAIEDIYQLHPALRPVVQGSFFDPEEGRKYPPRHLERP